MPQEDQIILVDEHDTQIGVAGKLEVHKQGLLHRAFSILVFNAQEELMLQKRASTKYHSGGLWTNTCCGHPRDGEDLISAAHRRLKEEMGFDCQLEEKCTFQYQTVVPTTNIELKENEMLHVFFGNYNSAPVLNPEEASDWKWISLKELRDDIIKNPHHYTYWFKMALHTLETKHHVI